MRCNKCQHPDTRVIDTRADKKNAVIKRRRECPQCGHRLSTLEEVYREDLVVIKQDGRREPFQKIKIFKGISHATQKRPIDLEQIEMIINDLCFHLEERFDNSLPSKIIGEEVMKRLKELDHIAYVRYASVYKDFRDISEMAEEISSLNNPA